MRNVTREVIQSSVQKTVERLKAIRRCADIEESEHNFLMVLKDHAARTGQDEIAEEITDLLIGWTDQVPVSLSAVHRADYAGPRVTSRNDSASSA